MKQKRITTTFITSATTMLTHGRVLNTTRRVPGRRVGIIRTRSTRPAQTGDAR